MKQTTSAVALTIALLLTATATPSLLSVPAAGARARPLSFISIIAGAHRRTAARGARASSPFSVIRAALLCLLAQIINDCLRALSGFIKSRADHNERFMEA